MKTNFSGLYSEILLCFWIVNDAIMFTPVKRITEWFCLIEAILGFCLRYFCCNCHNIIFSAWFNVCRTIWVYCFTMMIISFSKIIIGNCYLITDRKWKPISFYKFSLHINYKQPIFFFSYVRFCLKFDLFMLML